MSTTSLIKLTIKSELSGALLPCFPIPMSNLKSKLSRDISFYNIMISSKNRKVRSIPCRCSYAANVSFSVTEAYSRHPSAWIFVKNLILFITSENSCKKLKRYRIEYCLANILIPIVTVFLQKFYLNVLCFVTSTFLFQN